jgi:hypothetical protein
MHRTPSKASHATHTNPAARHFKARDRNPAQYSQKLGSNLVYGNAANDAFMALFDSFDGFDAMAREATQSAFDDVAEQAVAIDARRAGRR